MTETTKRLLTLPEVAAATGTSIDALRRSTAGLAAAGLIVRCGSAWVCEAYKAADVAAAVRPKPAVK